MLFGNRVETVQLIGGFEEQNHEGLYKLLHDHQRISD